MNKNIKTNFVFPPEKDAAIANIIKFCNDVVISNINNLPCSYADKKRIVEELAALRSKAL